MAKISLAFLLTLGVISFLSSSAQNGTTQEMESQTQRNITSTETILSSRTATSEVENQTQTPTQTSTTASTETVIPTATTTQLMEEEGENTTDTERATRATTDLKEELPETPTWITNDTVASTDWIWEPITWTWWLVFQVIFVILGLIGNFLVILVLLQRHKSRSTGDAFIGNLASADFLTSFFLIPLPRAMRVPSTALGEVYCKMIYPSTMLWMCILASTLTLVAISLERYLAIVHPIKFSRFRKSKHTCLCIILIWATVILSNLYIPLTRRVNELIHDCEVDFVSYAGQVTIGVYSSVICYAVPIVVMIVTNVTAARTLQRQFQRFKSATPIGGPSAESMNRLVAKNRILRLLVLVIIIFGICWGPNAVAFFLYSMGVLDSSYLYGPLDRILVLMAFSNSCANPIVYTLCYPQFRKALSALFTCSKKKDGALFE